MKIDILDAARTICQYCTTPPVIVGDKPLRSVYGQLLARGELVHPAPASLRRTLHAPAGTFIDCFAITLWKQYGGKGLRTSSMLSKLCEQ